jgi:hypothetical protein
MTSPRTIQSYAGPKKNAVLLANPLYNISQTEWNLLCNDVAQMTSAAPTKLWVQFSTALSNGAIVASAFAAQWGLGSANAPVVTRTGTGLYTVSTPASWATPGTFTYSIDPDQIVITSEQVSFQDAEGGVRSAITVGRVQCACLGYTISVAVISNILGVDTLSDLGGGITIGIRAV